MRALASLLTILGVVVAVAAVVSSASSGEISAPILVAALGGLSAATVGAAVLVRTGSRRRTTRFEVDPNERAADSEWNLAADDARD